MNKAREAINALETGLDAVMDVTIPWAGGNAADAAANAIVAQFNLNRPAANEPWHFELL